MPEAFPAFPKRSLLTHVFKCTAGLVARGEHKKVNQAGVWIPDTKIRILGVSIPEQSDVWLYVDIEMSTNPVMYQEVGHIFRMKYVGGSLYDYAATTGHTYIGTLITNTNIMFPFPYGIEVEAGTPIYVHLDVRNKSLLDITVEQDCYLYYEPI